MSVSTVVTFPLHACMILWHPTRKTVFHSSFGYLLVNIVCTSTYRFRPRPELIRKYIAIPRGVLSIDSSVGYESDEGDTPEKGSF